MSLCSSQILFKCFPNQTKLKMYFYEASSICFLLLAFFSSRLNTHFYIWTQKFCTCFEKYRKTNPKG